MPLLHRKPFVPAEYPMDLKENDEVFVCLSTKEIFKDYDEFCERIILCNSLVWSCSLTGRSHLTYQEAAASEEKVKKLLKCFPMELREPVLYLSSICERRSLVELAEDVYMFVKDRYFIGEPVEVQLPEGEVSCQVLCVIPPSEQELGALKGHKDKEDKYFPPASSYKYEVERLDTGEEVTVEASNVARKKSAYTKDKNRLYIKQFVHNDQGIWRLKDSTNVKYGISKIKFSHIFCGDSPDMDPKKPVKQRKAVPEKAKKQETLNKYFKTSAKKMGMSPRKSPKKAEVSAVDLKKRRRRRSKKEIEEDKARQTAVSVSDIKKGSSMFVKFFKKLQEIREKRKADAVKKELQKKKWALSRARYNEFVRQWNMKREDLECEDLKELPTPHPVQCSIPNESFGDVAMFMEFLSAFGRILDVKDFFPHGVTFELMQRCLTAKEVAGPLSDLLTLLLARIFGLLEGELEEIKQTDVKYTAALLLDRGGPEMKKLTHLAAKTDMWIRRHHGVPLGQLQLDTSTISEVLRLHLLTSGAKSDGKEAKWRYQARGGYCNTDDPALQFRVNRPEILEKLGTQSVVELETDEKVEIIKCLMNQILTYSAMRDAIEEGCEKTKQLKIELRALQAEQTRKEKEEAIRLKDLKKAGASGEPNTAEKDEEEKRERELRSGIINEKKKGIQALTSELKEAMRLAQMAPLGMDRAYRRYWLFASIPGIFVEDTDDFKGPCLPKCTPSTAFNHDGQDAIAYIRMLFKESCNKENISDTQENLVSPSPKKLLAERNGETTPVARTRTKSETSALQPLTCWADPENCPVHSPNNSRTAWSFIKDANELDRLIQSLNKRGFRERKLRDALLVEKDKLVKYLEKFPVHYFSPVEEDYEINSDEKLRSKKIMKSYEGANLNYPEGTPIEEIVEGSLRDLILETEEKISAGALGYLKVKDRDAWRSAIQNNSYDKQCKQLTYGCKIRESEEDVEEMDVDEDDEDGSRCSSPSYEAKSSGTRVFAKGFEPPAQRQVIQDLASAIVQVEQSIEIKFLKKPLGPLPNKEKSSRVTINPAMERWEQAVMESTNFAQLFLHLSTFENSVQWARSALNAFCRICRRRGDPQKMLLCDQCNKGHHMYCLKPKLTKIPSGDWFCPSCKPKETPITTKRTRKMFTEDSDEDDEEEDDEFEMCTSCNAAGAQLLCETCDTKYHLSCMNPPVRKVPKSSWYCHDCRAQNANLPVKKEEEEPEEVQKPAKKSKKEEPEEKPAKKSKKEEPEEKPAKKSKKEEPEEKPAKKSKKEEPEEVQKPAKKSKKEAPQDRQPKAKDADKPKKEDSARNSSSRNRAERRSLVNGRELDDDSWEPPRNPNGYVEEVDRLSRRKCSQAATAKISFVAKQLRSTQWAENGEVDENEFQDESRSRRSRRSLETVRAQKARDLPLDNASLQEILETLMHHKDAWPFLRPVSKSEVPDYHQIIKKPMDFATIKHKLNMLEYAKNSELIADAELLFDNCYLYNQEGSEVYKAGETLQNLFHKLCEEHNIQLQMNGDASPQEPPAKRSRTVL